MNISHILPHYNFFLSNNNKIKQKQTNEILKTKCITKISDNWINPLLLFVAVSQVQTIFSSS